MPGSVAKQLMIGKRLVVVRLEPEHRQNLLGKRSPASLFDARAEPRYVHFSTQALPWRSTVTRIVYGESNGFEGWRNRTGFLGSGGSRSREVAGHPERVPGE